MNTETSMNPTISSTIPEGFDAFYREEIEPELEHAEARRRKSVRIMQALAVVGVLGVISVIFHEMTGGTGGDWLIAIGFFLMFAATGAVIWLQYKLRKEIKAALVEPTCRFLGYEYSPGAEGFPVDRFFELRLMRQRTGARTKTEDMIRGSCNGIPFQLCEAKVTRPRRSNKDKSRDKEHTDFKGLLFVCEFPRSAKGETRVLKSVDISLLPKKTADGMPIEAVHLEESRFSQSFHVYASDQVEARYLLTPAFMEKLAALVDHFNPLSRATQGLEGVQKSGLLQTLITSTNPLSAAFVGSKLLISISTSENRFEGGGLFKPLNDRRRVEKLLQELRVVPEILDTLELGNKESREARSGKRYEALP